MSSCLSLVFFATTLWRKKVYHIDCLIVHFGACYFLKSFFKVFSVSTVYSMSIFWQPYTQTAVCRRKFVTSSWLVFALVVCRKRCGRCTVADEATNYKVGPGTDLAIFRAITPYVRACVCGVSCLTNDRRTESTVVVRAAVVVVGAVARRGDKLRPTSV